MAGNYSFTKYSDYDLQLLLDEAVEAEDYRYAAAIKKEIDRRKEEPAPELKDTGGYKDKIWFVSGSDLTPLGDIEQVAPFLWNPALVGGKPPISDDPEPIDHTIEFRPITPFPGFDNRRLWEDYKERPVEVEFEGVHMSLFAPIVDYIMKTENLRFKQNSIASLHPNGSFSFVLWVRNAKAGFDELMLFKRIFFPET